MPAILYSEDWPGVCVFVVVFGNSSGWEMPGAGAERVPVFGRLAVIISSSITPHTSEPMSPMIDGGPLDLFVGPVNWVVMI